MDPIVQNGQHFGSYLNSEEELAHVQQYYPTAKDEIKMELQSVDDIFGDAEQDAEQDEESDTCASEPDSEQEQDFRLTGEDWEIIDKRFKELDKQSVDIPTKDDRLRILCLFLEATKSNIFKYVYRNVPIVPHPSQSDQQIKQAWYVGWFSSAYQEFDQELTKICNAVYNKLRISILEHTKTEDHPLLWYLKKIWEHREMHTRRCKADPAMQRTKTDSNRANAQVSRNVITGEQFNARVPNHQEWRWIILNPLPTDYNIHAIDPEEGGVDHTFKMQVAQVTDNEQLQVPDEYQLQDPFGGTFTREWEKIFCFANNIFHFLEFVNDYVLFAVEQDGTGKQNPDYSTMLWDEAWIHMASITYASVTARRLSRERKKAPLLINRIAELRDILDAAIQFTK
jgi:hypothetical protein